MAGHWQHEIPALLQRGFGIRRSGRPKQTWVFTPGEEPKAQLIKRTNADADFYSRSSIEPSATLDAKITTYETSLAEHVIKARKTQPGQSLDPNTASVIVTHLAVRNRHVRELLHQGLTGIARGAVNEFSKSATIQRVLGLDSFIPSDVFRDALRRELRRTGMTDNVPESLAVQIMFQLAREYFEEFAPAAMDGTTLFGTTLLENATTLVREAHNDALNRVLETPEHAWDHLRSLVWTIEAAVGQAVLPDCVAIAFDCDQSARPLILADKSTLMGVVMPLSSGVLLVGLKNANNPINLTDFNRQAAACSYRHYQASANTPEVGDLRDLIGTRSSSVVDTHVSEALIEYFPGLQLATSEQRSDNVEESIPKNSNQQERRDSTPLQYEISFIDCADEDAAARIAKVVNYYVAQLSAVRPLTRLENITFAGDYPEALRAIDRGFPGSVPVETINAEIGVGLAKTVSVLRDGIVKARVVLNAGIGHALLDEDATGRWADYVLVYELALVSMIEIVDRALPGTLLSPIDSHHEGWLFDCVNSALDAYIAASFSANLGDAEEIAQHYRNCLIATLEYGNTKVPDARLTYRQHGNLDVLLDIAAPAVRHILESAANLLGHCDALDVEIMHPEDPLADALERSGLSRWLPVFQSDLRKFRYRLGQWQSFDEFLQFNRHAERLFWQFGMFPWLTADGMSRIEVPLAIDAEALTAMPPNK